MWRGVGEWVDSDFENLEGVYYIGSVGFGYVCELEYFILEIYFNNSSY